MTRNEYLKELEECLATLPKQEREAAVRFYAEYFDDAGADREQAVIAELGKPYNLAMAIIGGTSTYSMSKTAADTVDPRPIFDNTEEPEEIYPNRTAPKEIYPNRAVPEEIYPSRSVPAEIMPEPVKPVRQENPSIPENYRVRLVVLLTCILTVVVLITIAVVAFTSGEDNVAIESPAAPTAPAVTVTFETTVTYGDVYEYSAGDEYVYSDADEEYTIIDEGEATQIDQE